MIQAKADILSYLARQAVYNVNRGELRVVAEDKQKLHIYQELNRQGYIRKKKTIFGCVFQLSRKGWKALTKGQKEEIVAEYEEWVIQTRPTIAGPEWLEWR